MVAEESINEETLRTWIQEYRICWEVSPLTEMYQHKQVQVGFELHLFGRHPAKGTLGPGCSECHSLYQKLTAITLFALPKDIRPSRYEIDPYSADFRYRPESGWTPEVQLTLRVQHRTGYFDPIDPCEVRCSEEIQERLRGLGSPPNAWAHGPVRDVGRKAS